MTRRRGDTATGRPERNDAETRRHGDAGDRKRGDGRHLFAPSPCPRVAASDSFRPVAPSEEGKTIDVNSRRGLRGV